MTDTAKHETAKDTLEISLRLSNTYLELAKLRHICWNSVDLPRRSRLVGGIQQAELALREWSDFLNQQRNKAA